MNNDDNFRELIRLKNTIGEIGIELDKAHYILQDIVEDYIDNDRYQTKREQILFLLYERPRAAAKGHILTDIFSRIQNIVAEAEKEQTDTPQPTV